MQNIYPLFERNRILKKELLWSLRDYSFAHIQLEYQEYGQGLLRGCGLTVREGELIVGSGMIKCGGFICLRTDDERVPFAPAERMQYLKICVDVDRASPDYIAYRTELYIDMEETLKENEFELCRFNLRKGARLRSDYTGFHDMVTEYDTIILIHSSWGGLGGRTLAPAVTRLFAESILGSGKPQPEDRSFAHLCLSQPGAVPAAVLEDYIRCRTEPGSRPAEGNREIYEALCAILNEAGSCAAGNEKKGRERHRILVD